VIYLYPILAGTLYIVFVGNIMHISYLYLLSLFAILVLKRQDTTVLHLCCGLILFRVAELGVLSVAPTKASMGYDLAFVWLNTINFSIHMVFDITVLAFIVLRPAISRKYLRWFVFPRNKVHTDEELTYSNAEAGLIGVMFLYFFVDLAALVENFIRNMDYLGVDESIAKYFWEWTLVYNLYLPTKNFLNLFELLIIWLSISPKGGKRIPTTKNIPFLFSRS